MYVLFRLPACLNREGIAAAITALPTRQAPQLLGLHSSGDVAQNMEATAHLWHDMVGWP